MAAMAALASVVSAMETNAKPRERPVVRSIMRATSVTLPCCSKRSWRSFSVVSKERLPTYSFIVIFWSNTCELQSRSREPGFKSPLRKSQLTIYHATNKTELNPIGGQYRLLWLKRNRYFPSEFRRNLTLD